MVDVIIVGASVAGASTAWHLARLGHSVHLIDRDEFPRRKPCGEGVLPAGVAALDRMGVLTKLQPRSRVLTSLAFDAYGASVQAELPPAAQSVGVRRDILDQALIDEVERQGVTLSSSVTALDLLPDEATDRFAGVMTDKGPLLGRVVVAADGLGSRLRRVGGLQMAGHGHRYGASAHYDLGFIPEPTIQVHFERDYEVYVTPVGASLVNVALLLDARIAQQLGGRLQGRFDELAYSGPAMLTRAERVDEPLVAGPFPDWSSKPWRGNLVLAGDAAGFFDGISGEGMSIALAAAETCAQAISQFLTDGNGRHFVAYERTLKRLQRPSMMLGRLCLALAARPGLGRRAITNLGKHPEVFLKLIAISQGRTKFGALRPRDALALLGTI